MVIMHHNNSFLALNKSNVKVKNERKIMDAPISTMGRVSISISDETTGYFPFIEFGSLTERAWRKDCGLPPKISFGDFGPDDEGLNDESLNDEGFNDESLNDEFACLDDKPPSEDDESYSCSDVYDEEEEKVCPENHNFFLPQPDPRCVQCRGHQQSLEFGGVIGGEGFGFIRTTCQSCQHIDAYMTGVKCPNPHKNQGCLGILWVNPDGTISPMCKNCHRCDGNRCPRGYDGCLGARWFNSKTRNLEKYCVSCLHKCGPPKPTFKRLMSLKVTRAR